MSCKRLMSLAAALVMFGGCATVDEHTGSPDAQFGEASRWNAAMQIINPDPVYPEDAAQPGDHGEKAVSAVERYRTDRVKEPRVSPTSSLQSGGPGGGAGAGQGQGPQ